MKNNGNWKKGIVWKEVIQKHKGTSRGVRKWLTRVQLISHFGTKQIADAVIQRKVSTPDLAEEVREHPELPGVGIDIQNSCKLNIYFFSHKRVTIYINNVHQPLAL